MKQCSGHRRSSIILDNLQHKAVFLPLTTSQHNSNLKFTGLPFGCFPCLNPHWRSSPVLLLGGPHWWKYQVLILWQEHDESSLGLLIAGRVTVSCQFFVTLTLHI